MPPSVPGPTAAARSSNRFVRRPLRLAYKVAALGRRVYWFVVRPRTYGVKCVVEHDGKWLMIRNTYGRGHWTFPGGAVERGEAPDAAARREVSEEVGITLSAVSPLGDFFTDKQYKRDTVYCFIASVASADHTIDGVEIAEARWISPAALPDFRSHAVDRVVEMLERGAERQGEWS
jgi:8-oxo-dGTP pyrophosphatase MutT (NUDIX family)